MAKLTLPEVTSGFSSTTAINNAFSLIEAAIENTVSRDGTLPNNMSGDLDLNSQDLLNVGTITATEAIIGGASVAASATSAAASAAAALVSETNAAASEVAALASEIAATAVAGQLVDLEYSGTWLTATLYKVNNIVYNSATGSSYICLVQHTAGVFNDDLAALKWGLLASIGSAGAGTGDVVGPAGATADSLARFSGVTGKLLKDGAVIGTHVQAYDPLLQALAAQVTAANNVQAYSGADTPVLLSTGTASGNIPLVGTSSATDALAGLVELATPAEMVIGTDTTRAATAQGVTAAIDAAFPVITSGTFAGAASLDIDMTTTAYDEVTIVLKWVTPTVDGANLIVYCYTDGGTTPTADDSSVYLANGVFIENTTTPIVAAGVGTAGVPGTLAAEAVDSAVIRLTGLQHNAACADFKSVLSASDARRVLQTGIVMYPTVAAINFIRMQFSSGTLESGSYVVYGRK